MKLRTVLKPLRLRARANDLIWNANLEQWLFRLHPGPYIMAYHSIGEERSLFDQGENLSVSVETFRMHIKFYKKHFNIISMGDLMDALDKGEDLSRALVLTFDDGYQSLFDHEWIFEQEKIHATVFICTAFLDNKDVAWPLKVNFLKNKGESELFRGILEKEYGHPVLFDEDLVVESIRIYDQTKMKCCLDEAFDELGLCQAELAQEAGLYVGKERLRGLNSNWLSLGNHTHTHPVMKNLNVEAQRQEIGTCHRILTELLGRKPLMAFAFPFGSPSSHFDELGVKVAKEEGYDCTLSASWSTFPLASKMGALGRIGADGVLNEKELVGRVGRIL